LSIRILLADDHRIVREGIRTLLEKHSDLQVVAEAGHGWEAIKLARELLPDVAILDVTMPELNGMEAARQILDENPAIKVIGLSVHIDRGIASEMFKAGASGYLTKECALEELVKAIKRVMTGQKYLSEAIAESVVGDFVELHSYSDGTKGPKLTVKERLILQFIAEGKSTKEIAGDLDLSIKTVETHRLRIMNKLGITNVAGLVKYAIREGLTPLEK